MADSNILRLIYEGKFREVIKFYGIKNTLKLCGSKDFLGLLTKTKIDDVVWRSFLNSLERLKGELEGEDSILLDDILNDMNRLRNLKNIIPNKP